MASLDCFYSVWTSRVLSVLRFVIAAPRAREKSCKDITTVPHTRQG
jgi:hypothetical protein